MSSRCPYDVVLFDSGAMFLDLIFEGLPGMPELGREIFAKRFTIAPGGPYNTAVALARLGLNVALVAQIGTDIFSRYLEGEIKREGVDTRHLMRVDGDDRAVTVSLSFPKDRAFVSYVDRPGLYDFPKTLLDARMTRCLFIPTMPQHPKVMDLLAKAREAGIKTALDLHLPWGSLPDPKVARTLRAADLLLPNASEALGVSGEKNLNHALAKLGEHTDIAVKNGSRGAVGLLGGIKQAFPALKSKVVDTTGAGDCFNAGFLSGWINGRPLRECLARGVICGGLSVRHAGGTAGAPDSATLENELKKLGFSL